MAVLESQDQFEKEQAEKFIAETPALPGVDHVSVELGEDHSGSPSMWLVFYLESSLRVDLDWIKRFNKYAATIQTRILHSDLKRFPYTRLERAA